MSRRISLSQLKIGQAATVETLTHTGTLRRRLQDVGVVEGNRIECVGRSPFGDPSAYLLSGAVIAIRRRDALDIQVRIEQRTNETTISSKAKK